MKITGFNFNMLFKGVCTQLKEKGETIINHKKERIQELRNFTLVLTNPINNLLTIPERNLSLKYLAGELAFYFGGYKSVRMISHYSKFWNHLSDDGKNVNSCYGKKLLYDTNKHKLTQFEYAYGQLSKNSTTKKAVMVIYDKHSADLRTKDLPCTMFLQFFIRNNKLELYVFMRSNDIWYGLSYDLPFFTLLQQCMLTRLNCDISEFNNTNGTNVQYIQLGNYIHTSLSMHVYEKHFDAYNKIINSDYPIAEPYKGLIKVTPKTLKEMPLFIQAEKRLRTNNDTDHKLTDKLLVDLFNYLQLEE
jgi:thymidylate synthase